MKAFDSSMNEGSTPGRFPVPSFDSSVHEVSSAIPEKQPIPAFESSSEQPEKYQQPILGFESSNEAENAQ
jgi:hypothetical protein